MNLILRYRNDTIYESGSRYIHQVDGIEQESPLKNETMLNFIVSKIAQKYGVSSSEVLDCMYGGQVSMDL